MGTVMEIRRNEREIQHKIALDMPSREALAAYCRRQWPEHTAKSVARAFNLTVDEARSVVAGRASSATMDRVWKAGGWSLILSVMASVVGQSFDDFIAMEKKRLRDERRDSEERLQRCGEMVRHLPAALHVGGRDYPDRSFQRSGSRRQRGG